MDKKINKNKFTSKEIALPAVDVMERYELIMQRIHIMSSEEMKLQYVDYFLELRALILEVKKVTDKVIDGSYGEFTIEEKSEINKTLYKDILPENYNKSYGNPSVCVAQFGKELGDILSLLYYEVRTQVNYGFQRDIETISIINELFVQVYVCLQSEEVDIKELQEIIYWYASDYADVYIPKTIIEQLIPNECPFKSTIMYGDLTNQSYLYDFGEYITQNEMKTAKHLSDMCNTKIDEIATTIVDGFVTGFKATGKDLSLKSTVNVRYVLGFERIVRRVVELFDEINLSVCFYSNPTSIITKRKHYKSGYFGAVANKQYDYDHKDDTALFMDKKYLERKLDVTRNTYESIKEYAAGLSGPVVIEMFGETPFVPEENPDALTLTKEQQKTALTYTSKGTSLTNQFIKPEERSYSIIAFPVPEIGERYPEIFDAIVEVNTLDASMYRTVQQTIIDALDSGTYVMIKGRGQNRTNLTVQLQKLNNPEKETGFENCVADVNIPVGEVFTSPCLQGTTGILHVSKVYLHDLQYVDLELEFEDGKIIDYRCENFKDQTMGKKYIKENILNNHETLPMGEFAIGTNTTAYEMAKRFDIEEKLPILIAEKMGPHFAVGDTCYSWSEDIKVYNPNGKEIIAKENEISVLRKTEPDKAYFHCHTDITIPYEEIKEIAVCDETGKKIKIIENGEFVLPGTEILNEPLQKLK